MEKCKIKYLNVWFWISIEFWYNSRVLDIFLIFPSWKFLEQIFTIRLIIFDNKTDGRNDRPF